jgi:ribonuclease HI
MIFIYTDGACHGNQKVNVDRPGGWAYIIIKDGEIIHKDLNADKDTTNNKMELTAIIKGLEYLTEMSISNQHINIRTDSMYVLKGVTEWMSNWKKNNWKNAKKETVKNSELWKMLDRYHTRLLELKNKIEWKWVKAHATDKYNNLVDRLANDAIALLNNKN